MITLFLNIGHFMITLFLNIGHLPTTLFLRTEEGRGKSEESASTGSIGMILLHVYNITSILVMKNDENHETIKLGKKSHYL